MLTILNIPNPNEQACDNDGKGNLSEMTRGRNL